MATSKSFFLYAALPSSFSFLASALGPVGSGSGSGSGALVGSGALTGSGAGGAAAVSSAPPVKPPLAASSPLITFTPSATESTFIMRGSFMYCPNLSGFFCTSVSIAMKSGWERNPRVDGSVASLPYSSGEESMAPMLPIGSAAPAPELARAAADLTSARPDLSTSDSGSIARPASYAAMASSKRRRPYSAAPLRLYPLDQSGLISVVFSASASAASKF